MSVLIAVCGFVFAVNRLTWVYGFRTILVEGGVVGGRSMHIATVFFSIEVWSFQ